MAALKDSDKRARCDLVYEALRDLLSSTSDGKGLTRREFFTPLSSCSTVAHLRASNSQSWQQPVLDRLVHAQILKKEDHSGTTAYMLQDAGLARSVLLDWKVEGLILTRLVFPAAVSLDAMTQRKDAIVASEVEAVGDEIAEGESEDVAERVGKTLVQLIKVLDRQYTDVRADFTALTATLDHIRDGMVALAQYQDQLSANLGSVEKRLGGNNKRLDDVEGRLLEVSKKLDKVPQPSSYAATLSPDSANLISTAISNAVASLMQPSLSRMIELTESASACADDTANSASEISDMVKDRRLNQVHALLHRLDSSVKDQGAMRELLLEMVSKEKPA